MASMMKRVSDYRGFEGPDIDIATSLFEYGLVWKKAKKDEYIFIYGVDIRGHGDNPEQWAYFDYAFMNKKDWTNTVKESWFSGRSRGEPLLSRSPIEISCDMSLQGFINQFPYSVQSAIAYHGTDNIFGSSYSSYRILDRGESAKDLEGAKAI
jgi:hypothetical protein